MRRLLIALPLLLLASCGSTDPPVVVRTVAVSQSPLEANPAERAHPRAASPRPLTARLASASLTSWPVAGEPLANVWAAQSDKTHCAVTTSPSTLPDNEIREVTNGQQVTASTGSTLTTPGFARGQAIYFDMPARNNSCYGGRTEVTQGNPYSSSKVDRRFYAGHRFTEAWQFAVTPTFLSSIKYGSHNGSEITQIHVSGNGKSPFGVSIQPGGPKEELTSEGQLRINYFGKSESYVGINTGMAIKPNVVYSIAVEYDGESTTTGSWKVYAGAGPNPPLVAQESGLRTIRAGEPDFATLGWYPGYYTGELGAFTGWEAGFNVAPTAVEAEAYAFGGPEPPPPVTETTPPPTTETTPPSPPSVPAAPTGCTAVPSGLSVKVSCPPVSGATSYVFWRTGPWPSFAPAGSPWTEKPGPEVVNTSEVAHGREYVWHVAARNSTGTSPRSAPIEVSVP